MNDAVTRIRVPGTMPYDVVIGTGLLAELTSLLDGALRVAIVHPGGLRATADSVREDLASHGFEAHTVEVPDGEDAKTLRVAGYCWDVLGTIGFTRSDAIVGLGGGATTDLTGWVAASWLRGVRVVQVPTTLAGMVDAAIADRHRAVLGALGLPTIYRADAFPALLETMRIDKKARGTRLRFVVLD